METNTLTQLSHQADPTAALWQVGQHEDDAPARKRQQPGHSGASIMLPEDQVTLSDSALQGQSQQPSQPVSLREKAALLGPQKVARFSVYG